MIVRASRDLDWIAKRTGGVYSPGARAIEAVDKSGTVVGMVGYDGWTHNAVQMSIALDVSYAWWALARPAFAYPFEERERGVVWAMVSSRNVRSMRLTSCVGFAEKHRIKDAIAVGIDLVLFEMRPSECRWLRRP